MLINIAKRNVIIKLCLVGVIQALYIILVPPPLQRALELNDFMFLIAFIVVPIALNIFFVFKMLSSKPEYIKFRYTMIPFIAWTIVAIMFLFTGFYGKYVRIFTGIGALDLNSMGYFLLLFLSYIFAFIALIISYLILLKYRT